MSDILVETFDGVTTLTLNRVARKNAITADMYALMAGALVDAAADDACRVLVIQGHETIFSAGNDIADFLNNPPAGPQAPVFQFLHGIAAFPKPVLASVCVALLWALVQPCCCIVTWSMPVITRYFPCRL